MKNKKLYFQDDQKIEYKCFYDYFMECETRNDDEDIYMT